MPIAFKPYHLARLVAAVVTSPHRHHLPWHQGRLTLSLIRPYSTPSSQTAAARSSPDSNTTTTTVNNSNRPQTARERHESIQAAAIARLPFIQRLAARIAPYLGLNSPKSVMTRQLYLLYEQVAATGSSAVYSYVVKRGVPDSFQTWFGVVMLHVWMLMVRFRAEGVQGKKYNQLLVDLFFKDMEDRIWNLGMTTNNSVQRALKDFYTQFHGMVVAYDSAVFESDALFASALLRNVFQAHPSVNPNDLVITLQYVRGNLKRLDLLESDDILYLQQKIWDHSSLAKVLGQ